MLKPLLRALLVFRLRSRPLPIDWDLALTAWLQRPAIEISVQQRQTDRRQRLCRRLDEVYPF